VPCPQSARLIAGDLGRRWHLGQDLAIRPPELRLAVWQPIDLEALLVHSAVMPATQQRQVRECGGAAMGLVADVMALAEPDAAAREAAVTVSMVQRSP
jgi:hypothetical protein